MNTSLVNFKTEDNLTLHGLLFQPENKTKKAVVHVHGSAGNFYENSFINSFAESYVQKNFAFFSFNNRGCELTKEIRQKDKVALFGMLNEIFEDCVLDIEGAIAFLKSLGYIEFVLQGHSLGCNKVVQFCLEKDFKGRVILLAPCDLAKDRREEYLLKVERAKKFLSENKQDEKISGFWDEWDISAKTLVSVWSENAESDFFRYRNLSLNKRLEKLTNEILVIIGSEDTCYDQKDKHEVFNYLFKAFKNAKLKCELIDGGNHHYKGKTESVISAIKNWNT